MKNIDELTPADLDDIWKAGEAERAAMVRRQRYYAGQHDILSRSAQYADGTPKTNVVTNWIAYAVNRYVGAISDIGITVKSGAEEGNADQQAALAAYQEISDRERLVVTDTVLLRDALVCGHGIEVHSFDDALGPRITRYDPAEWRILWLDERRPLLAIHQTEFKTGDVFGGGVLDRDITVRTVYAANRYDVYLKQQAKQGQTAQAEFVRDDTLSGTHEYGDLPIVVWTVDDERQGLVSEALMRQNDEYNESDSANGDSLKREADDVLKIRGVDPNWLARPEVMDLLQSKRILPLPDDPGADADFLHRVFDNIRTENRIIRTRRHLHMMAEVPDVGEIVGTSGATSGIALKLMFTPMQERAETMIANLKGGVRRRIDLLNAIAAKRNLPKLEDYEVTIQFRMPVNRIEEWANIGHLNDQVSHKTRLRLLTDIADPAQELEEWAKDQMRQASIRQDVELSQEPAAGQEAALVEKRDREVKEIGDSLIAGLEPSMMELSEAITAAIRDGFTKGLASKAEPKQQPKEQTNE